MARIKRIARTILRRLRDARGDALVEFALVAPLLFLVLFGMIDFGKAFNYWLDENHLAAQAARLAAVDNTSPAGTCLDGTTPTGSPLLLSYIKCNADSSQLRSNATVCVHFPAAGAPTVTGNPVKITVSTDYTWLPIIGSLFGGAGTTTITGDATMRLENNSSLTDGQCTP
jgi:Flp pilus assembly protein TadG